jgi:hypothetical protein
VSSAMLTHEINVASSARSARPTNGIDRSQ